MTYKNIHELAKADPPAVICNAGYLERPENGWVDMQGGFIGIGYHGSEYACFSSGWQRANRGLGHVPSQGYG